MSLFAQYPDIKQAYGLTCSNYFCNFQSYGSNTEPGESY